jgi:UDP-glucose 4-epimerase
MPTALNEISTRPALSITNCAYNIGSGQPTSVRDVLTTAEKVTGKPVPVRHAPPANEPPVLLADATQARARLDWQPSRSDLTTILRDAWEALIGSRAVRGQ